MKRDEIVRAGKNAALIAALVTVGTVVFGVLRGRSRHPVLPATHPWNPSMLIAPAATCIAAVLGVVIPSMQ